MHALRWFPFGLGMLWAWAVTASEQAAEWAEDEVVSSESLTYLLLVTGFLVLISYRRRRASRIK